MNINSRYRVLPGVLQERDANEIKNEPMLFNCDARSAAALGGALTNDFLSMLPGAWKTSDIVVDSRSHMLMPGWYPCIPGWHHDDVPRSRADGQPNYEDELRAEHILALVGGSICPTEFALGTADFVVPELGRTIYADWDVDVDRFLREGQLLNVKAPTNRLVQFDDRTWHRGTAAVAGGWRWFIRASRYFRDGIPVSRPNVRTNEVRNQVQVYMPTINAGW
jgi:hypothetical protein